MSNQNSIQSEIYRRLIKQFLNSLTPNQRDALGDEQRIRVDFVQGDQEAVELAERSHLLISPITPVLHIKAESVTHQHALELSYKPFCRAAAAAGFEWLSFSPADFIGYAFWVKK
jgi:hypothetical protein